MDDTLSGMTSWVRPVQWEKAELPRHSSPSGRVSRVSPEQWRNASSPIRVRPAGKAICSSWLFSENASRSMACVPSGTETLYKPPGQMMSRAASLLYKIPSRS